MHDFHITLSVTQNCAHSHTSQRVLSGGAKWGCYGLVLVPVLEILSGGTEYPLDPLWRRPCALALLTSTSCLLTVGEIIRQVVSFSNK